MRALFYEEVDIETSSTIPSKFAQCSNSKCRFVFHFETIEEFVEANFLCPECRHKLTTHHVVQCRNCQTIVNLFAIDEGEEPVIFYVNKCSHCHGSIEDERRIQPFLYPELYM
ncbi:MAG TPA: hypothetical protein PLZ15_11580 [Melioribacteraceae bacterium]|nr:hypothetical protein [Melioribacteraceae bacterium]